MKSIHYPRARHGVLCILLLMVLTTAAMAYDEFGERLNP